MNRQTALLAAGILAALILACVLAGFLPQGKEDITFEYQVFLKEIQFDVDGNPVSLVCTLFSDPASVVIVSLERVQKAVTPSGKTSFKKLSAGDLLFVSVDPEGGVRESNPPVIVADVVMVKSLGAPNPERTRP
ncbi:MAG: hypothetical protein ACOYIR_09525 [Christensenellales bacterium]